jgi:hypothetical protein
MIAFEILEDYKGKVNQALLEQSAKTASNTRAEHSLLD